MKKLYEQWPWHTLFLKYYIITPIVLSPLLIGLLYPAYHFYSLSVLIIIPCGIFIYHSLSSTAKKIRTLLGCISAQNGEAVEALLVIDKKRSPGIVILRDTVIILIPIDGRRRKLKLTDIKNISRTNNLPDKHLFSKTVFILETQKSSQYIFAVSSPIGNRWSKKLLDNARNPI